MCDLTVAQCHNFGFMKRQCATTAAGRQFCQIPGPLPCAGKWPWAQNSKYPAIALQCCGGCSGECTGRRSGGFCTLWIAATVRRLSRASRVAEPQPTSPKSSAWSCTGRAAVTLYFTGRTISDFLCSALKRASYNNFSLRATIRLCAEESEVPGRI